jgi:hypothetical protein
MNFKYSVKNKFYLNFNSFCRRNPLNAIITCMHEPVNSCIFYETFQCNFIDFHVKKKKTFKNQFPLFLICLELSFHSNMAYRRSEDRNRSGRPRVPTRAQDRYNRTIHRNRFQTATATAAYTSGTHNNRIISA